MCIEPRQSWRAAKAGGQQDGVCPPGIRAGAGQGLPEGAGRDARGEAPQGLHLQLRQKIHEHCDTTAQQGIQDIHQGSLRDRPTKVTLLTIDCLCL